MIFGIKKHRIPTGTTLDDMVWLQGNDQAGLAGHEVGKLRS